MPIRYNCMLPMVLRASAMETHLCKCLLFYAFTVRTASMEILSVRLCSSQDDYGDASIYSCAKLLSLTKAPMLALHVSRHGALITCSRLNGCTQRWQTNSPRDAASLPTAGRQVTTSHAPALAEDANDAGLQGARKWCCQGVPQLSFAETAPACFAALKSQANNECFLLVLTLLWRCNACR